MDSCIFMATGGATYFEDDPLPAGGNVDVDVKQAPVRDMLTMIAGREKVMNNPIEVYTSEYQFAGRNVIRYEIFTRRPHAHRYAYRTLVSESVERTLEQAADELGMDYALTS